MKKGVVLWKKSDIINSFLILGLTVKETEKKNEEVSQW